MRLKLKKYLCTNEVVSVQAMGFLPGTLPSGTAAQPVVDSYVRLIPVTTTNKPLAFRIKLACFPSLPPGPVSTPRPAYWLRLKFYAVTLPADCKVAGFLRRYVNRQRNGRKKGSSTAAGPVCTMANA